METIKVNMSPNPLDVQTIHASQNDNEARQWEFELHNNGELIDTSDVKEQLVFKAYKGGTEEILPTNGSTPTTSPIIADIKYPQGLLTDQEFTYRQSPTEEDGLAKITDIKGNTLNWNQLIENGNFADTSKWSAESGATLSISNNIATISSTTANNGIRQYFLNPLTVGHKYLIKAEFNVPTEYRCVVGTGLAQGVQTDKLISTANTWTEVSGIKTCTGATTSFYCYVKGTTYENVKIRNVMCFDLTQMSLDITDPSEFTSLFSLPYYSYNQGSLLSFNGNGIKTVGKNLLNKDTNVLNKYIASDGTMGNDSEMNYTDLIPVISGETYHVSLLSKIQSNKRLHGYNGNGNWVEQIYVENVNTGSELSHSFVVPSSVCYLRFSYGQADENVQIEFGSSSTTYEAYTSNTLSLPISTYFPTGMKKVKSGKCDELLNNKAIKKIERIDMGSLAWQPASVGGITYTNSLLSTIAHYSAIFNQIECSIYDVQNINLTENMPDKAISVDAGGHVQIKDSDLANKTREEVKEALSGQYLYYELATPIETSITTASLVTENAEIPLSNEDGTLIGKCTEQLSENPGFIDAKIKLSDADGECYSNKIQLHVERSPQ